jgi:hypothetical protein
MLTIHSDHPDTSDLVQQMAELCAAHGAHWHPDLQVDVRDGSLCLLAPPGTPGEMISLPTELLVPIQGAQWAQSADQLQLLQPPAGNSTVQNTLLQLHIALYNATGKLHWWRQQHPARLVEACPTVAAVVAAIKPGHRRSKDQSAAEGFLATRSFGWRAEPVDDPKQTVLMPLIDLLNHHHRGAPYRIEAGAMRMATAQPESSGECFAHYGHRRDGLDLALHYGHADPSTPFAHCAPLQINVEGVGLIQVQHQMGRRPAHPGHGSRGS